MPQVIGKRGMPQPLTSDELRRTPKKAKLHANRIVPLDFFREALKNPKLFLEPEPAVSAPSQSGSEEKAHSPSGGDQQKLSSISAPSQSGSGEKAPPPSSGDQPTSTASVSGKEPPTRFGLYSEALLRDCYNDLLLEIDQENTVAEGDETASLLIEIRGSAGIGKSAFLALLMAEQKISGLKDFALFHAPKADEVSKGLNEVLCCVWIDGELKMDGMPYGWTDTRRELQSLVPKLEAIFMDGCSMGFSIEDFSGMIYVAASPSVSTKNLRKALGNHYTKLYMPPWSLDEAIAAGGFLNERDVVEENYAHMKGIARHLFEKDSAKKKVEEAVTEVNPQTIVNLVASNETDKATENTMVHSLVSWEPKVNENGKYDYRGDVRFELVSRFAEKKIAEKLSKVDLTELSQTRRLLSPVTGAEGYAGALFEAYAIKKICGGGTFKITRLEAGEDQDSMEFTIPRMDDEPVIVECNTLTPSTVPLDSVHVKAEDDSWLAKVLWPLTSNFPTFDCFYFHTDGEVYPLQMTIAKTTHDLKNNGAYQTMEYLNKIDTCKRPYKAVFICPKENTRIKRQKFTGNVKDGKQVLVEEKAAAKMMDKAFQQWILQL